MLLGKRKHSTVKVLNYIRYLRGKIVSSENYYNNTFDSLLNYKDWNSVFNHSDVAIIPLESVCNSDFATSKEIGYGK